MSEFRCFDAFTLNNFSSSDYIKKKKRGTLFTNAQTIAIGNANYQKGIADNAVPPGYLQKEDGGGTFFNPVYVGTTEEGSRCLIGAHSYDVLYDVLYGAKPTAKKYEEIVQDIASAIPVTSEGWVGGIMEIDFKDAPLGKVGPAITNVPNGSADKMNYPARQDYLPKYDDPENPPTDFPGMIIDPCYNVFYPQCSSKYKTNNYLKNVRYNPSILFSGALSLNQTVTFIQNKLYQNVDRFPYPLDFSATSCVNQRIPLPIGPTGPPSKFYPTNNDIFQNYGYDVMYGNGVWIAVGGGGINTILRSTDGINWSTVNITSPASQLNGLSVLYANNLWIVVGSGDNTILISNDNGINWSGVNTTSHYKQFTTNGRAVAYGNGRWVAVGEGGNTILTSTNGTDWSSSVDNEFSFVGLDVAYGNGRWVAVGGYISNTILTSTNGTNWSFVDTSGPYTQFTSGFGKSVSYDSTFGMWIAVGAGTNKLLTSMNGTQWSLANIQFASVGYRVRCNNGTCVAVGGEGGNTILISTNGGTYWSPVNTSGPYTQFTFAGESVAFNPINGTWVAVGSGSNPGDSNILSSPNGIDWLPISTTSPSTQFGELGLNINYGDGIWVAVGGGVDKILYSN